MMKRIFLALFLTFTGFNFYTDCQAQEAAVRGVWVPAPRFTNVLHTYQNVDAFVNLLADLKLNAIFLVSYAENKTLYPSKVLKQYSGAKYMKETSLLAPYFESYKSSSENKGTDPIKDLIKLAHQKNIKVFFWYEYGFMGDTKPITKDNLLLANNPDWLGIANDGSPAAYHKKDYYFNSYNPKVQDYMIKLIEEGIQLYPEIDGIQGDDRLPAMPKNSGYDNYTINKYKSEHGGKQPSVDFNDKEWVDYRIRILNQFCARLYKAAHRVKEDIIVSFAPNPYPWSKDNLMQDWPSWLANKNCDLLAVQCYRYNIEAYTNTVTEALSYINVNNPKQLFAPGIILMEGGATKMSPDLLKQQIAINRKLGINGEIFFYNEALKVKEIQDALKEVYTQKLPFPKLF